MSLVQKEDLLYFKLKDGVSINKEGLVLTIEDDGAGSPVVDLVNNNEIPCGVALKTTEDPLNPGTYLAGVPIAVVRRGVAKVAVSVAAADTAGISVGDVLVVPTTVDVPGHVKRGTPTAGKIVGIALEPVAKPSSGTVTKVIKALLTL